jgi:hypothetical protein
MNVTTVRSTVWQPPGGPSRAAGGLMGVAGGEAFAEQAFGDRSFIAALLSGHGGPATGPGVFYDYATEGPVTRALLELADSYVLRRGHGVPVEVAERNEGLATPAWLLAVAITRSNSKELIADTLELANAAGVPSRALGDCVAYVELASGLFAGRPAVAAIETALGHGHDMGSGSGSGLGCRVTLASSLEEVPPLCGEGPADALSASIWALNQPGGVADVMPALAAVTTPGVGAAAAGLLGLRDGCAAMPAHWQRRLRSASDCLALAPGLVRARCRGHQLHRHVDHGDWAGHVESPDAPCVHGVVAGVS